MVRLREAPDRPIFLPRHELTEASEFEPDTPMPVIVAPIKFYGFFQVIVANVLSGEFGAVNLFLLRGGLRIGCHL